MASIGALAVIASGSALYLDQPFRSAERQPTTPPSGGVRPTQPIVVAKAPKVARTGFEYSKTIRCFTAGFVGVRPQGCRRGECPARCTL